MAASSCAFMSLTDYIYSLAHFRYTNRANEQVSDHLLEQLTEKYPDESTPVLKREFATLDSFI